MKIEKSTMKEIRTALRNGSKAQLILRDNGKVTAHEHVGQSWTETNNGVTVGWIFHRVQADTLRIWDYDPTDVRARLNNGSFDLDYEIGLD